VMEDRLQTLLLLYQSEFHSCREFPINRYMLRRRDVAVEEPLVVLVRSSSSVASLSLSAGMGKATIGNSGWDVCLLLRNRNKWRKVSANEFW
jgi:hypothetical protein